MSPAAFCLHHRTITLSLTLLAVCWGVYAYQNLGRLSYPDFTIKTAMVTTQYPGATPKEVEEQVTEVVEEIIQSMSEVEKITSNSQAGVSYVTVEMLPTLKSRDLPQIWDVLRKKLRDGVSRLPQGCATPKVTDDFGDVYGIYYALTCADSYLSDETQLRILKEHGRWLKKELLNIHEVRDIAKIDFYGVQQEVIYLEIPQSTLSSSGISPQRIMEELANQNLVVSSGKVRIGDDYVRITPTGEFQSLENILDIIVSDSVGESVITLRDIVESDEIRRETLEPPPTLFRFNGKPAIAMGISTRAGGNVVFMGEDIEKILARLKESRWPDNLEIDIISNQAQSVTEAVDAFLINVYESVAIVVVLLMIFMGWRSGLIIGVVLLLTILATFIVMYLAGITLQIISLGALIIALGMLVDNAIVVLEETLIAVRRGKDRESAAAEAATKNQLPLLGATFIAILAFAAIGFAPDNIGEFCASLFQVLAISLLLSWVTAVTILPLLCVWFLPKSQENESATGLYDARFYRYYRALAEWGLNHRAVVLLGATLLLAAAGWGFTKIPESFFGNSTRNQFFIDYWRAEGTAIEVTDADTKKIEEFLLTLPGVVNTSSFIGSGSLRYILSYEHRDPNSCFSQILVTTENYEQIPQLAEETRIFLRQNFPDAMPQVRFFREGPSVSYAIELEFRGENTRELHRLAEEAKTFFAQQPATIELRDNWRQRVKVLRPEISDAVAKRTGITRASVSQAIQAALLGNTVGFFRVGEDVIPIVWRLPENERADVENLGEIQIYSTALKHFIRLDQVSSGTKVMYEYPIIRRVDRKPAVTVQCNASGEPASVLRNRIASALKREAFSLPPGCEMTWRGEFEASNKGKDPLMRVFPLCFLGMFLICVAMYDSFRQPTMIFLTIPFSVAGVTAALLLAEKSFEFLCIPGFLGLTGMLIKNGIVLVTDTDAAVQRGESIRDAVLDTATSRLRPVALASGTTVLGVAPLLVDPFYGALAATISGGLCAATVLTLFLLPVFYEMLAARQR